MLLILVCSDCGRTISSRTLSRKQFDEEVHKTRVDADANVRSAVVDGDIIIDFNNQCAACAYDSAKKPWTLRVHNGMVVS